MTTERPEGMLHDDDVFVPGLGYVSAQFAAELPMILAALICPRWHGDDQ